MRKHYIIVEHRNYAVLHDYKKLIDSLKDKIAYLEKQNREITQRFGYEVQLNAELIDLLNSENIPYRERLDYRNFPF